MATDVHAGLFTVAVFLDVNWAGRGLDALKRQGFPPEALTIIGKETPELAGLIELALGAQPDRIEVANLGSSYARGSLVAALQGADQELTRKGVAATIRRVGLPASRWTYLRDADGSRRHPGGNPERAARLGCARDAPFLWRGECGDWRVGWPGLNCRKCPRRTAASVDGSSELQRTIEEKARSAAGILFAVAGLGSLVHNEFKWNDKPDASHRNPPRSTTSRWVWLGPPRRICSVLLSRSAWGAPLASRPWCTRPCFCRRFSSRGTRR